MHSPDSITQSRLKELLHYIPNSGLFTWRVNRGGTAKAGAVAGGIRPNGYRYIKIDNITYFAHRLAFLYILGWMPTEVDHDDRVKSNNRWKNLNASTHAGNMKNHPRRKTNISGTTGVSWNKRAKKWTAYIRVNYILIHLGDFPEKSDAIAARAAANIKYGFHPNHGKA